MMEEGKQIFRHKVYFHKGGSWIMTLPKILAHRWGMDSDRSYTVTIESIGHRRAIIEIREGK